jgi:cobalt-zinc-cadmium efflux system outer membrane protein
MKRRLVVPLVALIAVSVLAGCAPTAPQQGFANVQSLAMERLGKRVEWDGRTADDRAVASRVRDLLAHPLDAGAAVQIALLNNRSLQATFEELGIAQADFLQAGLLDNPVFNLSVRLPNGPPKKTYLDIAAAENFLNVFLISARRKIAAAQLQQATARVSAEVLSLAAQTESAFYTYQAATQTVELRRRIADAAAASLDAATRLRQAGNTTDLDYYGQRAQAARATVDLANAESDAADARECVNALMGAWGAQTAWSVAGRLPDVPPNEVRPQGLETLAIQQRQDLAAARGEVLAQARLYGFTVDTRFFAQADLGIEGERETDGQCRIGPTLSLPIPLFDQGQAAIPRAAAVLRQSQQRYAALAVDIRAQVRAARARMLNARAAAQFYRDEVLPTQRHYLDQAQLQYNGMFVSVFQLLQAKRDEIDAAAQYIQALRTYWTSRAELARAVGGRLPPGEPVMPSSTQPTSISGSAQGSTQAAHDPHSHGDQP